MLGHIAAAACIPYSATNDGADWAGGHKACNSTVRWSAIAANVIEHTRSSGPRHLGEIVVPSLARTLMNVLVNLNRRDAVSTYAVSTYAGHFT
jgi:hypothetical protein